MKDNFQDRISDVFQLLKEKKFHEAEQLLLELLAQRPDHNYVKALLANVLLKQHRVSEALEQADEVLQRANNPEALAIKGLALVESNQLQKGIECLELSLHQREHLFYRSTLVQILLKNKLLDAAGIQLKILLDAEPDHAFYRKLQSRLLTLKGKDSEAMKVLQPPGEATPSDPFEYSQYLRLKIKSKPVDKALSELQILTSLPQHRENPHLMTLIGELQTKLQLYDQAEKSFQNAQRYLPDSNYLQQKFGFLYSKMKQFDRVIEIFTPLFLNQPTDVFIRKTLERAYENSNRLEEFQTVLEQTMIKHPELKSLHGILKRTKNKLENCSSEN